MAAVENVVAAVHEAAAVVWGCPEALELEVRAVASADRWVVFAAVWEAVCSAANRPMNRPQTTVRHTPSMQMFF